MTVDEYLAWADTQEGRFELVAGTIYARAPEPALHAEIKLAVHMALVAAIRKHGLPCHVLPAGMTFRVDDSTAYEPDSSVLLRT